MKDRPLCNHRVRGVASRVSVLKLQAFWPVRGYWCINFWNALSPNCRSNQTDTYLTGRCRQDPWIPFKASCERFGAWHKARYCNYSKLGLLGIVQWTFVGTWILWLTTCTGLQSTNSSLPLAWPALPLSTSICAQVVERGSWRHSMFLAACGTGVIWLELGLFAVGCQRHIRETVNFVHLDWLFSIKAVPHTADLAVAVDRTADCVWRVPVIFRIYGFCGQIREVVSLSTCTVLASIRECTECATRSFDDWLEPSVVACLWPWPWNNDSQCLFLAAMQLALLRSYWEHIHPGCLWFHQVTGWRNVRAWVSTLWPLIVWSQQCAVTNQEGVLPYRCQVQNNDVQHETPRNMLTDKFLKKVLSVVQDFWTVSDIARFRSRYVAKTPGCGFILCLMQVRCIFA